MTLDGNRRSSPGNLGASFSAYGGGGTISVARNGTFATTYSRPRRAGRHRRGHSSEARTPRAHRGERGPLRGEEARRGRGDLVRLVEGRPQDPGLDHQAARLRPSRESTRSSSRSTADRSRTTATASTSKSSSWPRAATWCSIPIRAAAPATAQEFGNLIHHAYPGDDFYDLDSGVDAVDRQGLRRSRERDRDRRQRRRRPDLLDDRPHALASAPR